MIEKEIIATITDQGDVRDVMYNIWEIKKWIKSNRLEKVGKPFAIYYTDPKIVTFKNMIYEVGIPIKNKIKNSEKIKIKEIPRHKVIYAVHHGPYDKIKAVYKMLYDVLNKKKL
ncbi:GyrI-like domain-containing protein [Methanobrevibacter sp. DSM 116169]|uniref:GyrI-like domain-containing protein n=1 Tax=Methanobrevibacter sp. DSM 116169 TaxID=3242727 RepID=UPI0038FCA1A9